MSTPCVDKTQNFFDRCSFANAGTRPKLQIQQRENDMKIEGVDEFARSVGKAGETLGRFGKGADKAGKGMMAGGFRMMLGGALVALALLLWWLA
jgi:meiotically up-regulated gene 157 (Mug157) protein